MICSSVNRFFTSNLRQLRDWTPNLCATQNWGDVDDYLLKPFDLLELNARLHSLQRRAAGRCVNSIEYGRLSFDPSIREVRLDGQLVDLSRREQALLKALLDHRGQILSTDQLKDFIYGFVDDVESNALNVHIYNLRRKLGSNIVETIRGMGYRIGEVG